MVNDEYFILNVWDTEITLWAYHEINFNAGKNEL